MTVYEIRFTDNTTTHIDGDDPVHASQRAADLYNKDVIAWRHDRRPRIVIGMGVEL